MKKDGYQAKVYKKYIESLNYGSNIPITETTRGIQIYQILYFLPLISFQTRI